MGYTSVLQAIFVDFGRTYTFDNTYVSEKLILVRRLGVKSQKIVTGLLNADLWVMEDAQQTY